MTLYSTGMRCGEGVQLKAADACEVVHRVLKDRTAWGALEQFRAVMRSAISILNARTAGIPAQGQKNKIKSTVGYIGDHRPIIGSVVTSLPGGVQPPTARAAGFNCHP